MESRDSALEDYFGEAVVATGTLSPGLVWCYIHESGYWRTFVLPDHVEVLCVLEPRRFDPNGVGGAMSGNTGLPFWCWILIP